MSQGLRFGAAIAIVMTVPYCLIFYAVQPWPMAVVVKQIVYDGLGDLLKGVVVALLNQAPRPA